MSQNVTEHVAARFGLRFPWRIGRFQDNVAPGVAQRPDKRAPRGRRFESFHTLTPTRRRPFSLRGTNPGRLIAQSRRLAQSRATHATSALSASHSTPAPSSARVAAVNPTARAPPCTFEGAVTFMAIRWSRHCESWCELLAAEGACMVRAPRVGGLALDQACGKQRSLDAHQADARVDCQAPMFEGAAMTIGLLDGTGARPA